jgi:hypothetical protein
METAPKDARGRRKCLKVFLARHAGYLLFVVLLGVVLGLATPASLRAQQASAPSPDTLEDTIQRAISTIRVQSHSGVEYDYIMTARVRLLLFWASKEDVGGGYIREGASPDDSSAEILQIVMGSDPAKTPMAINRWGAAWELLHRADGQSPSAEANTFIGFMKVSKGTSVAEMQKELAAEKNGGGFLFSTILNQATSDSNFAKEVPFQSDRDFTINQLDQAEPYVFDHLAQSQGKLRSVDKAEVQACGRSQGFLSSVAELIDDALQGSRTPVSLCYIYNGQRYSLKLEQATPLAKDTVQLSLHQDSHPYVRNYQNLLRLRCENANEVTGKRSNFELLVGTSGALRGVPVRISYQPNWWFQVVLNLKTPEQ